MRRRLNVYDWLRLGINIDNVLYIATGEFEAESHSPSSDFGSSIADGL